MKSSELASLAGVTVRALRHYHQLGVLPEPRRGPNGYRDYAAGDLIRLLRIKRFAALGIPLEAMPALLDNETRREENRDHDGGAGGAGPGALLDALEADIDAELARLHRQKTLIAGLRQAKALDLPPELARFVDTFAATAPEPVRRMDREQAVLLAHLAGEEGLGDLAKVYEQLSSSELAGPVLRFYAAFAELAPGSSAAEVEEVVAAFVSSVALPLRDAVGAGTGLFPDADAVAAVCDEYLRSTLNPTQQQALASIADRLAENEPGPGRAVRPGTG